MYAAEVHDADVRLEPSEHSEYAWPPFDACLERVHYRGLKDGLRSVQEYITGVEHGKPGLLAAAEAELAGHLHQAGDA